LTIAKKAAGDENIGTAADTKYPAANPREARINAVSIETLSSECVSVD
jgi:hypothetical protein